MHGFPKIKKLVVKETTSISVPGSPLQNASVI